MSIGLNNLYRSSFSIFLFLQKKYSQIFFINFLIFFNMNSIDKLTLFSTSNRKNNTYNYEKIAKNIVALNTMLNLHLSETDCKAINTKVSQFVECKTKGESFESRVKKSIRLKIQKANIIIEECKDNVLKNKYISEMKKVEELIF